MVDVDDLITTESKLIENRRTAMWVSDEADILIAQQAPADTFIGKMYRLKNTNPITVIEKDFNVELASVLERSFWLSNSLACLGECPLWVSKDFHRYVLKVF